MSCTGPSERARTAWPLQATPNEACLHANEFGVPSVPRTLATGFF
jgi:hypothetical protein